MASKVSEDLVENIWLADKDRCNVVVCVREKPEMGPPIKKRICDVSASESNTKCDAVVTHVSYRCRKIRVHTVFEGLASNPYFQTYLKESWCKQQEKEGSSLELPLETLLASPQAYERCIEILCSSQPCSPRMFSCPLEALDIYLASDHLLFSECSAACMDYLAAAPFSNEERKVIYETFLTSGIKPSDEVAARLGLSKEKPARNLTETLWSIYKLSYFDDPYGMDEDYPGGYNRVSRFHNLISSILEGHAMSDPNKSSKKAISEFLYRATADCVQKLKASMRVRDDAWVNDKSFAGWLHMMRLIVDITDGKEAVEAMACNKDLRDLFFPTLNNVLEEHGNLDPETRVLIWQLVKLLVEVFKRVAEMKVMVSETTRSSLVMSWVPWLESIHENEKVCDATDMPILKDHINKIVETLSMDDDRVLGCLAHAAMNEEYFLAGAFKSWCERFD